MLVKNPPAMQETPVQFLPGLGSSLGEGIGYPLQYSWASLVAQMGKNQAAIRGTWVRSLGGEDLLKESRATHSSILAWRIPMNRGPGGLHLSNHAQHSILVFIPVTIYDIELPHQHSVGLFTCLFIQFLDILLST